MGECLIMRRGGETYKPAVLNTAYPQDVTKTVIKGNTTSATFSVLIAEAGTPAEYTYQWYKDGAAVSGATSSSYTISGLGNTATHTVYCEVTNKGGTVQSRTATLKVTQQYTPVLNTSYPADVSKAEVGGSATFKVTIATAGVPAAYTYQWYVNGSAVSGATSSSYTRSNLAKGSYTIYCKVTNAAGTVQSRTATLTVTKQYLFNLGDKCTAVTGGWTLAAVPMYTGSGAQQAEKPQITTQSNGGIKLWMDYGTGIYRTTNKIDLTGVTTLTLDGSIYGPNSGNANWAGMFVWSAIGSLYTNNVVAKVTSAAEVKTNPTLDVSSLNGSYYIGFGLYDNTKTSYIIMNSLSIG